MTALKPLRAVSQSEVKITSNWLVSVLVIPVEVTSSIISILELVGADIRVRRSNLLSMSKSTMSTLKENPYLQRINQLNLLNIINTIFMFKEVHF